MKAKDAMFPIQNYFHSAEAQRDADWERVKPLVEILQAFADRDPLSSDGALPSIWDLQAKAQRALAQLGVEVKP